MSTTEHHHLPHEHGASTPAPGSNMGVHGMLVFGGERAGDDLSSPVYVSHLSMFMTPHDFQVIARVTGEAAATLLPFVAHFGTEVIYSFMPEKFSIDELDAAGTGPVRTSFKGNLFRGHFERGGSEIADDVAFDVEEVVHFRRYDETATHGELCYLCFGTRDAAFMAHLISAPPDFDQIIAVEIASLRGVTEDDLRAGLIVTIRRRANSVDTRLAVGEALTATVQTEDGARSGSIELTVASEYYLETGDLDRGM